MKEIKIPFSLDEYKKGGYSVKTRDGRKARIICTDCKTDVGTSVISLVDNGRNENWYNQYPNGRIDLIGDTDSDLFLFKHEFEDGDIISFEDDSTIEPCIGIFKSWNNENSHTVIVYTHIYKNEIIPNEPFWNCHKYIRIATEEEKQKLFDALAKKSKQWNTEKKCIEDIKLQYDFKPFDRVLARDYKEHWRADLYSHYNDKISCKFICIGSAYMQCIPYNEETKHLLGTKYDAPEKYKN